MINVKFSIPDDREQALIARVREGGYKDVDEYVRNLVQSDLDQEEDWEVTPQLLALLEEGERSGISERTPRQILEGVLNTKL